MNIKTIGLCFKCNDKSIVIGHDEIHAYGLFVCKKCTKKDKVDVVVENKDKPGWYGFNKDLLKSY